MILENKKPFIASFDFGAPPEVYDFIKERYPEFKRWTEKKYLALDPESAIVLWFAFLKERNERVPGF